MMLTFSKKRKKTRGCLEINSHNKTKMTYMLQPFFLDTTNGNITLTVFVNRNSRNFAEKPIFPYPTCNQPFVIGFVVAFI